MSELSLHKERRQCCECTYAWFVLSAIALLFCRSCMIRGHKSNMSTPFFPRREFSSSPGVLLRSQCSCVPHVTPRKAAQSCMLCPVPNRDMTPPPTAQEKLAAAAQADAVATQPNLFPPAARGQSHDAGKGGEDRGGLEGWARGAGGGGGGGWDSGGGGLVWKSGREREGGNSGGGGRWQTAGGGGGGWNSGGWSQDQSGGGSGKRQEHGSQTGAEQPPRYNAGKSSPPPPSIHIHTPPSNL